VVSALSIEAGEQPLTDIAGRGVPDPGFFDGGCKTTAADSAPSGST
jgi:hypothetical protein